MFEVLAQSSPVDIANLSSQVQTVAQLGWTVVVLQVITIVAGVITSRDKMRFDLRMDRLETECINLRKENDKCNQDHKDVMAQLKSLRSRFDADFQNRNPESPIQKYPGPTDTISGKQGG